MAILSLNSVSYRYSSKSPLVLKCVNGCFSEGVIYAITGKSGSGKSTLLSLLSGLDLPTSGNVLFQGVDTKKKNRSQYRRKDISIVYQDFCLLPLLTVLENIMYPMQLNHVRKEETMKTALELAQKVQLPSALFHRYPNEISGGEQQRTAIARALTMNRSVILADEPTGNLDSENSRIIINILEQLAHKERKCIIIATHDLYVMNHADQVLHLNDGCLDMIREKEAFINHLF